VVALLGRFVVESGRVGWGTARFEWRAFARYAVSVMSVKDDGLLGCIKKRT
jgi:hypothetical protein